MRKGIVVGLVTTIVGMLLLAQAVEARRGRRMVRARNRALNEPPVSAEISKAVLPWGTGKAKVIAHHTDQIRADYTQKLAKVGGDAILEDRLRSEMDAAISKIRDSYLEFRGQRTGWRVSYIGEEFRDNSGESMVVVTEASDTRFYFFKNDALYKMFIAFNAEVFPGLDFEQFAERIQERYGPAQRVMRTNPRTAQEELVELRWQDDKTLLAAIDQTGFYGIFCLRFTDKNRPIEATAGAVAGRATRANQLIDVAIREGSGDSHSDVVDQITGRRRAAPAGAATATKTTQRGRPAASNPAPAVTRPAADSDPMAGLDDL